MFAAYRFGWRNDIQRSRFGDIQSARSMYNTSRTGSDTNGNSIVQIQLMSYGLKKMELVAQGVDKLYDQKGSVSLYCLNRNPSRKNFTPYIILSFLISLHSLAAPCMKLLHVTNYLYEKTTTSLSPAQR